MLHKIRHACAGGNSVELPAEMPEFPHYSDPVEKFRQELERVGGVFLDGRRSEKLAGALGLVLKESDSTEIYWEGEELFQKHGISFTLRNLKPLPEAACYTVFIFATRFDFRSS